MPMMPATLHNNAPRKESGVVLLITLIVLVAMTLAAIALIRSVDTSNIIAGNLAFQQAATQAADSGTEDAVNNFLPSLFVNKQLTCVVPNCPAGYVSWRQPLQEPPSITWDSYWQGVLNGAPALPRVLPTDALGNTVSYIVESMCDQSGQTGTCLSPPPSVIVSCSGSSLGDATQRCQPPTRKYYRITSRVVGPRNSVSFIQAFVAM